MASTIKEGSTLKAKHFAAGEVLQRVGAALKGVAAIDAITDGTLPPAKLSAPVSVYLKSPNNHYWRLSVSDAGVVSASDVGTDTPSVAEEES